jgi:GT2 family glycosyltransferase
MPKSSNPREVNSIRLSVIIPTYQRRDVVVASVSALSNQAFDDNFEVIVVVDGSQDGSVEALKKVNAPYPLLVLEQPNQGRAAALNQGARAARGEILLFLDDDMQAHPRLLAEHDRSHRQGVDMVLGHIPLHPESPANFLSQAVGLWAEERARRLSSPEATLELYDLITGQASVSRQVFNRLGGFDPNFDRGGSFGNEDLDFCYRLQRKGYRVSFNSKAISWQKYVVTPRHHLRQWHQAGCADVVFARKHPDQTDTIFALHPVETLIGRILWRPLCWPILKVTDKWPHHPVITWLFFWLREHEYWQGVREAGGVPGARLR